MKSYIKNNNKGTIVETIKNKPTGSVKGMAKIELINDKTGEVEVEGLSENIVYDYVLNRNIANQLQLMSTPQYLNQKDTTYVPLSEYGIRSMQMTDYNEEENLNLEFIKGSLIAAGTRSNRKTPPTRDVVDGEFNAQLSGLYPEPFGDLRIRTVFDWGADYGNGTFKSIFLSDKVSLGSTVIPRDNTARYLTIKNGTDVNNLTYTTFQYPFSTLSMTSSNVGGTQALGNISSNNILTFTCGTNATLSSYPLLSSSYWIAKVNISTGQIEYNHLLNPDGTNYYSTGYGSIGYSDEKAGRINAMFVDENDNVIGSAYRSLQPQYSNESSYCDKNMKQGELKIVIFNNDGSYKETQILQMEDVKYSNDKGFKPRIGQNGNGVTYIGGTSIIIFGAFADMVDSTYSKVQNGIPGFIVYDYNTKTVTHKIGLADVIKYSDGADISRISLYGGQAGLCYPYLTIQASGYNADGTSIPMVTATYDITNLNDVKFVTRKTIDENSNATNSVRTVDGKIITCAASSSNGDTSTEKHNVLYLTYTKPFAKPLTHTLLPEPITKSNTQSMRITYDLVIPKEMLQ